MVNIDPMSKVMSLKTVLNLIQEKTSGGRCNMKAIRKELINTVVYTKYPLTSKFD